MFEILLKEALVKNAESIGKDQFNLKEDGIKDKDNYFSASNKELSNYNKIADGCENQITEITLGEDTLRDKIAQVHPEYNEANISKMKGDISEDMMDSYFKNSGWSKKEGEVGVNGIDGLYVKRDSDGNINNVLAVESKYNTSKLGETNAGMQMSKTWLLDKLDTLIKAYPEDSDYADIKSLISEDKYRARLWKMNEVDNDLYIGLKNINSVDGDVSVMPLTGTENYKINDTINQKINLDTPDTMYHSKLVSNYNEILNKRIYTNQ